MELNSKNLINPTEYKGIRNLKKEQVFFAANPIQLYEADLVRRVEENKEKFLKTQPWFVKLSNYFSADKFQGDIANVIITGIGTGLVSPLMIRFNPLSKEDSDTKTYAAWRQPISAVIAIATQVGITKKVKNIVKDLSITGSLGREKNIKIANKYSEMANKLWKRAEFLGSISESPARAEFLSS